MSATTAGTAGAAGAIAKVKVCVRIRPLLPRELAVSSHQRHCISAPHTAKKDGTIRTIDGKDFLFDSILPERSDQQEVYRVTVQSLFDGLFKGFNATVFAFGQTGSGKTYTMGANRESLFV